MRAGISITSHGRREELLRCLASVERLDPPPARVAVHINGDSDGALAAVLDWAHRSALSVEVLAWPLNHGPWAGDNAAIDRLFFEREERVALDANEAYYEGFPGWHEVESLSREEGALTKPTVWRQDGGDDRTVDFILQLDDDATVLSVDALAVAGRHLETYPSCGFIQARLLEDGRRDEGDEPLERAGYVSAGVAIGAAAWCAARPYPAWLFRSGGETIVGVRGMAHGWQSHYLPTLSVAHEPSPFTRPAAHFHGLSLRNRYLLAVLHQPTWRWPLYWVFHFGRSCWRRASGRLETSPLSAFLGAARLLPAALGRRQATEVAAWKEFRRLADSPRRLGRIDAPRDC